MEPSNERIADIEVELAALARERFGTQRASELASLIKQAARSIALVRDTKLEESIEPDFLRLVTPT